MKVILYMAISANGIIARENSEEDFLSHENWETFVELARKTGCMIWGKKTHEVVKSWGKEYQEEIKDIKKVVISTDKDFDPGEGFDKAATPQEGLQKLENAGFKQVILSGGAKLNSSFAKAKLIDEIILNVNSVIVGKGIPLFSAENFDLELKLLESKLVDVNIIQLHYTVLK